MEETERRLEELAAKFDPAELEELQATGFGRASEEAVAAFRDGLQLKGAGDKQGAEEAFGRAFFAGHPHALLDFAGLRISKPDVTGEELIETVGLLLDAEERFFRSLSRGDVEEISRVNSETAGPVGLLGNLFEQVAPEIMESACRKSDEAGNGAGSFHLGIMLRERGELAEAAAAGERAGERGVADGLIDAAVALQQLGDLTAAVALARRASSSKNEKTAASASGLLGVLLEQTGDREGALAAYRQSDARGDPNGTFNHGVELMERGNYPDAEAAIRRAQERGADNCEAVLAEIARRAG